MRTTIQNIQEIIQKEGQATAKSLREQLGVSQVLVHRHLKRLCTEGIIQKVGSPPKVFYIPVSQQKNNASQANTSKIIEKNWLEILPNGRFLYGFEGFEYWCNERNTSVKEQEKQYEIMFAEKESWKTNGLIDASEKITQSFEKNYLEKVWYIDFYSWEVFGKTLLGKLILYAKQNSDVILMKKIAERIKTPLLSLLQKENFDAVGIIPHSVQRKKDFLQTTLSFLNISPAPQKVFSKVFAGHSVAQKTLKSKKERVQNATETLFLNTKEFPKKILLLDDACGSGATLNIAAKKIKDVSPFTKVHALTFVGSIKGFEVIAES